jgi:hypothetical protein
MLELPMVIQQTLFMTFFGFNFVDLCFGTPQIHPNPSDGNIWQHGL